MSSKPPSTVVTVRIGAEEYSIRTHATPEYARKCAAYVDDTVGRIMGAGSSVEPHRAIVLAALSLADQLLEARGQSEGVHEDVRKITGRLIAEIEAALEPSDLAPQR